MIWLHAREEFADNRFQLLFIYIDKGTWCSSAAVSVCRFRMELKNYGGICEQD